MMEEAKRAGVAAAAVREAGHSDAPDIAAIASSAGVGAWSTETVAGTLSLAGCCALLAPGGEPDGFIIVRTAADEAEIIDLAVRPPARRRGVGRLLVKAAVERAARDGAAAIFLEVAENNVAARKLYESMDFQPVGRRADYYRRNNGEHVDAIIMHRLTGRTTHD